MLKIRRSNDRPIFNMGIPYLERRSLYCDSARCGVGGWNPYPFHQSTDGEKIDKANLETREQEDEVATIRHGW